jgi:hypothetical protein
MKVNQKNPRPSMLSTGMSGRPSGKAAVRSMYRRRDAYRMRRVLRYTGEGDRD